MWGASLATGPHTAPKPEKRGITIMGIRSWLGLGQEDDGDRSLIEVSNDRGDHIVIEVPTAKVWETKRALRKAGVERDDDENLSTRQDAVRRADNRDSSEYRCCSARIIDEREDLEDSYDSEAEVPRWSWW